MKRFLAVLALPAIAALLASGLAACFSGLDLDLSRHDSDAGVDAGHECEEHGGTCEAPGLITIGGPCASGEMPADYACPSSAFVTPAAQCCVPRPPCESILVGLGREAPRCLPYDKCAPDGRLSRGFCDVGYCCSPSPPFTPPPPPPPVDDAGMPDAPDDG